MISCKGKTVSAPGVSLHVDMTAHLSSYHRVSCVDAVFTLHCEQCYESPAKCKIISFVILITVNVHIVIFAKKSLKQMLLVFSAMFRLYNCYL